MPVRYSSIVAKPVPGFPGYRATSEGNVETQWAIGPWITTDERRSRPMIRKDTWKIVKPFIHKSTGRPAFTIQPTASPTGKQLQCYVHIFVCLAFHGEKPEGQQACHYPDQDVLNNRPENLSWGTPQINQQHRLEHGTDCRGEKCATSKLTAAQIVEIRTICGLTHEQIGKKFGIAKSTVTNIRARRSWAWLD